MSTHLGKACRVHVSTDSGTTWVLVGKMNSYEKKKDRTTDSTDYFEATVAETIPGTRTESYTISGKFDDVDAGQVIVRNAEANDTEIMVRVFFDGTNGFKQSIRIGTTNHKAATAGLQDYSFDALATAAATKEPTSTGVII